MGANQSNLAAEGDDAVGAKLARRHGYQILRVHPNSPVSEAQIFPYFDYIISINSVDVSPDIPNIIGEMARNHVNKPLKLGLYNSRQDEERQVTIVPRSGWGGEGLLGCAIRFCPLEGVRDRVWHILKVHENSPAQKAGLIAEQDYLIASPDLLLNSEDEFYQLVTQNIRRENVKTVSEVRTDESGRSFKVTRKIRMKLVTESVEPEVAHRRSWKKFGLSANDGVGPNIASTILGEPVFLNLSMDADFDKQEVSAAQAQASEAKSIKCRFCEGPHFSLKCPYKDTFASEGGNKFKFTNPDAASGAVSSENVAAETPAAASAGPAKYVPKFKRSVEEGGLDPNAVASVSDDRDNGLAIRITNLSDMVVESDIRELVGAIGVAVARCNVGRDRVTGRCKGYAFVNFYSKEDAETVMRRLNGFPYGNLILKVEIARPVEK